MNKIVLVPLLCSMNNVMSAVPLSFMTDDRYRGWDEQGIRAEREACEDSYYEYFRERLDAVSGYYPYECLDLANVGVPHMYLKWFAANFPNGAPSKTAVKKQLARCQLSSNDIFTSTVSSVVSTGEETANDLTSFFAASEK